MNDPTNMEPVPRKKRKEIERPLGVPDQQTQEEVLRLWRQVIELERQHGRRMPTIGGSDGNQAEPDTANHPERRR